jgi:hypothetical protein
MLGFTFMNGMQRSLAALGLLMAGAVGLSPVAVYGQTAYRDAKQAPPTWIKFAKSVQSHFEGWIEGDDEVATRFRQYVTDHAGKPDGLPSALTVRAWVNPDGSVEKVTFDALSDPKADADLHTILSRGNIGEPPPPEMMQPLNLRFSLNQKKLEKANSAAPAQKADGAAPAQKADSAAPAQKADGATPAQNDKADSATPAQTDKADSATPAQK